MKCFYCSTPADGPDDLRPYGPNGALICFPCGTETPERAAQSKANMDAHMAKVFESSAKTGAPVLLGEGAPRTSVPGSETVQ